MSSIKTVEINIDSQKMKVTKDEIFFIWLIRNLLTDIQKEVTHQFYFGWAPFWLFILNDKENKILEKTKFHDFFLNHFKDNLWHKNWRVQSYELWNWYSLYFYYRSPYRKEVLSVMKKNLDEIKIVFNDKKYEKFQKLFLDTFWLYWSFSILRFMWFYLYSDYFLFQKMKWKNFFREDYWYFWNEWDLRVDIKILQKIIDAWKEEFSKKMDLLYLMNKTLWVPISMFPRKYFLEMKNEFDENNWKFEDSKDYKIRWYITQVCYLCTYIFKEFLDDYIFEWKKAMMLTYVSFYKKKEYDDCKKTYEKFSIKDVKNLLSDIDKKACKKYLKSK